VFRLLFQKSIAIRKLSISEISIFGQLPHSEKKASPSIMPVNLRIGRIVLNKIDFGLEEPALKKAYNLQSGVLILYDLKIEKRDTLSPRLLKRFDFKADGFQTLSKDSMYTYKLKGVDYKCKPGRLAVKEVVIHPNYSKKRFAELHRFATDRMDGRFSNIVAGGFSVEDLIKSKRLGSSGIEIDGLNLIVFRDNRKVKLHVVKPVFQQMMYLCPVSLNLDSIHVKNGDITYIERVPKANHEGYICFKQIDATLYNVTNDKIYKRRNVSLILKGDALLMGKGRFSVLLDAKLYDRLNTFTVKANLSHIPASSLNPLLSNNVFMKVTSGEIESMNFFFTANDLKAKGSMCLLYHDLKIAVINKKTEKSNALKERFLSMVLNSKILDSNPLHGKKVRVGKIEKARDPEKFLFNYCVKSIVSGIQTSIL
jgi:fructose-specific component phosphotransferase system IIB-like protein